MLTIRGRLRIGRKVVSAASAGKIEPMSRIDELYLARMEAESMEQAAWEALQAAPDDADLARAHRDAVAEVRGASTAYLDALIDEERRRQSALVSS